MDNQNVCAPTKKTLQKVVYELYDTKDGWVHLQTVYGVTPETADTILAEYKRLYLCVRKVVTK